MVKVTLACRKRVAVLAAGGMSHEAIAAAMGMCRNALEQHFRTELDGGAADRRAKVVQALYDKAMSGNVSAQKAFIAMGSLGSAKSDGRKSKRQEAVAAARDAAAPGNDFAPPAPPKLVVNNR